MPGLFSGFGSSIRPGLVRSSGEPNRSSQPSPSIRPVNQFPPSSQLPGSQLSGHGLFGRGPNAGLKGKGLGGKGLAGKFGLKRRRKIIRDSISGITKGDIRRLARRGGVKRMSGSVYDEIRQVVKNRVELILNDCYKLVEYRAAKTVTVHDIIFSLKRLGTPVYGFGDVETRRLPPGRQ